MENSKKNFFEKTTPNLSGRHIRHSEHHGWRPIGIFQGKKRLLSKKLQKKILGRQLQICQNTAGEPRGRHKWRPLGISQGKKHLLSEKLQKKFLRG